MDKKYVVTGLGYAILGLVLGIYMAASKNHGQIVTHAHIMLLGFVVSFIYGTLHKVWLKDVQSKLVMPQFILHQIGTLFLLLALFLMFGKFVSNATLEPVLSISSILVLAAMILMKIIFIQHARSK